MKSSISSENEKLQDMIVRVMAVARLLTGNNSTTVLIDTKPDEIEPDQKTQDVKPIVQ